MRLPYVSTPGAGFGLKRPGAPAVRRRGGGPSGDFDPLGPEFDDPVTLSTSLAYVVAHDLSWRVSTSLAYVVLQDEA